MNDLHLFGIRHHGPGSARSLLKALHELKPDCVLVEGPAEGEPLLPLMLHAQMEPPIAMLVYAADDVGQGVFYPFARFSPEWQALRYALEREIPVRLFDLPQTHLTALARETAQFVDGAQEHAEVRRDPLDWLAQAAGYSDGERWWDHQVEQRQDGRAMFTGIQEAMTALRQELPDRTLESAAGRREALREAWMRRQIRKARRKGFGRIAVVCGAWHVPALAEMPAAKEDDKLLKGLPKVKVNCAWVPWSHGRLSYAGGYGAGIEAPGWYDHLWRHGEESTAVAPRWLSRAARLLREEGLDASSAGVVEAVRLAETLAALRGRPLPGLPELNEAVQSVLCFGDAGPMRLIEERLLLDDRLGRVPPGSPTVPLQRDLEQQQKQLRLKPEVDEKELILDLRTDSGLARSRLLHRLRLLDITWGRGGHRAQGRGTFKEQWRLSWQPDFAMALIDASIWGTTVAEAADARARQRLQDTANLRELVDELNRVLLADLPDAVLFAVTRLQDESALTNDIAQLMDALPGLAEVMRYGDVRGTDGAVLTRVIEGLVERVCIGLPAACYSLDDDAAAQMFERIDSVHQALARLQRETLSADWHAALTVLLDQPSVHGLVSGRCCRLLLDAGILDGEETVRRVGLSLSKANEPLAAGHWLEGFLRGSGLLLLHDDRLWSGIEQWMSQLKAADFTALLPLLRRTFARFSPAERRAMGERVSQGGAASLPHEEANFDQEAAEAMLPILGQLLGLS